MLFLAQALFFVGVVAYAITYLWLLGVAFKASIWWGLGSLFLPFVLLFFLIAHWEDAAKPFGLNMLSLLVIVAGVMLHGGGA